MTTINSRRLRFDLLRDQVADIRFCNKRLAMKNCPNALDESHYRTDCVEKFRSLWKVRHTCHLDRNGWPMKEWGHFRLEECKSIRRETDGT